ncbi:MAG: ATP synthase subunit I [Gammaproteobacteria bacterium]
MRAILSIQVFIAAVAAVVGYLYGGTPVAFAALYGAAIALSNTLLLVWRQYRGKRVLHADAHRHLRSLYFSILERYFVVGGLFVAGLGGLHLAPPPLLIAFVAGQLAWLFSWIDHG